MVSWISEGVAYAYPTVSSVAAAAQILGLRLPSSRAVVRAAYRRKAATCHPDTQRSLHDTEEFIRVTAAYELLLHPATLASWSQWERRRSTEAATQVHQRSSGSATPASSHAKRQDGASASAYDGNCVNEHDTRVLAWQEYWQAALLASHAESQLRGLRKQIDAAQSWWAAIELQQPSTGFEVASPSTWEQWRIRSASARAKLDALREEERLLVCRVQSLRNHAMELERTARGVR